MNKIKVHAVKDRMLLNLEKLNSGIREYIGWNEDGKMIYEAVEVPNNQYYRRAIKNGDLAIAKEKINKNNKV